MLEYVKINECLLKMWIVDLEAMPTSIFLNNDDDDNDEIFTENCKWPVPKWWILSVQAAEMLSTTQKRKLLQLYKNWIGKVTTLTSNVINIILQLLFHCWCNIIK